MKRIACFALAMSALCSGQVSAQPAPPDYYAAQAMPVSQSYGQPQVDLGGGFIEFLVRGAQQNRHYQRAPMMQPLAPPVMQPDAFPQPQMQPPPPPAPMYVHGDPRAMPAIERAAPQAMDPRYLKQVVDYTGDEEPGTIIIDTPRRFLFLVQEDGKALRYGIGVGRPGFTWSGVKKVSRKAEWPDWRPPSEMLKRRPDLPHFMAGGPNNPLGARALYLGSSLYRIHGSNEPWTIGKAVSSGCIRMRNEDVIDLYEKVNVGTKVVVI